MIFRICQHPKLLPLIDSTVFGPVWGFMGIGSDNIQDTFIFTGDLHIQLCPHRHTIEIEHLIADFQRGHMSVKCHASP